MPSQQIPSDGLERQADRNMQIRAVASTRTARSISLRGVVEGDVVATASGSGRAEIQFSVYQGDRYQVHTRNLQPGELTIRGTW
jgi:hypothetical protein